MYNWLLDKKITLIAQVIVCVFVYAFTFDFMLLSGVLAVFIILEFGLLSHCHDHLSKSLGHSLKYSQCYSRGKKEGKDIMKNEWNVSATSSVMIDEK